MSTQNSKYASFPAFTLFGDDHNYQNFLFYVFLYHKDGKSAKQISESTGVSARSIQRVIKTFRDDLKKFIWDIAPSDAIAFAMDSDRSWHFYAEVPTFFDEDWEVGQDVICVYPSFWHFVPSEVTDASKSLILRPAADDRCKNFKFKPEEWMGRTFKCNDTGETMTIPDDVKPKQFFKFGDCFIDVGDGMYSRAGGDFIETTYDEPDNALYTVYSTPNAITVNRIENGKVEHVTLESSSDLFDEVFNDIQYTAQDINKIATLYKKIKEADNSFNQLMYEYGIREEGGSMFYREDDYDYKISNNLANRIMSAFASRDVEKLKALAMFTLKVHSNPNKKMVDGLYDFLQACNIEIDEAGDVIAYKRVRDDYMDMYTGEFDNSPGQSPEVPRNTVDPDDDNLCSTGLHVCSLSYLPYYGGGCGRIVKVAVHPADFISFPKEYFKGDRAKARCCLYQVLEDVTEFVNL